MREIKFKVWDGVDYMSRPFTLDNIQRRRIEFTSDCVLLQLTGVLDRNGKELYEGDIIAWEYNDFAEKCVSPIRYNSNMGCFDIPMDNDGQRPLPFEILGNIYQNPELLS